jgi:formamidopyrimidine-DNA glycosylase
MRVGEARVGYLAGMPELPDVEVFRRRLVEATTDRRIEGLDVLDGEVLATTRAELDRTLAGSRVSGTRRHGKQLYVGLGDGPLLRLHFGMTGYLTSVADHDELPRHTRVVLALSRGRRLLLVDQRKLGEVGLVGSADDDVAQRGLGPDALDLDLAGLREVLARSRGALKPTLMDQGRIAGLGNIYSDEVLFQARLDPRAPAAEVSRGEAQRLHRQLRRVLERAVEGEVRDFPRGWLLHRRDDGARCPRCGGPVERFTAAGRHGFRCLACQSREG